MTIQLAQIVAKANIQRLAMIGLAKNVGKTTTTNHLLETLLGEKLRHANELAITSLGLDGEQTDALTGLPKPRYVPQTGVLVATTADLLRQAESEGTRVEQLLQLAGRTALGPVILARILHPGKIIIAGPTLLRDLRNALESMQEYGARLSIVDGAINRLGAANPSVTQACIVCTGASAGATAEVVARRTADVLIRLQTVQTELKDAYTKLQPHARLLKYAFDSSSTQFEIFSGGENAPSLAEPESEAQWIVSSMSIPSLQNVAYMLRGAFTEELARELLTRLSQQELSQHDSGAGVEIVVGDATKIFCHSVVLHRLAARGLYVRVAEPMRILAVTINPYTPDYVCTPQRLLDALVKELPAEHPPIIDVVSGLKETL